MNIKKLNELHDPNYINKWGNWESVMRLRDDAKKEYRSCEPLINVQTCCHGNTFDETTSIGTFGIYTCTGIAVSSKDDDDIWPRFVAHAFPDAYNARINTTALEQFLGELEHIKTLKVKLSSTCSFCTEYLKDYEEVILTNVTRILKPYKKHIPDSAIPLHRSMWLRADPNGEIITEGRHRPSIIKL